MVRTALFVVTLLALSSAPALGQAGPLADEESPPLVVLPTTVVQGVAPEPGYRRDPRPPSTEPLPRLPLRADFRGRVLASAGAL